MPDQAVTLAGAQVLLVDDTPENLKVLRQTLEQENFSILVATGGEQAINLAEKAVPDMILLDVMMPALDGFETCRRLKSSDLTREIPVIFITGRSDVEAVVEGFHVGGVDYIVKPFRDDEVLMRVRTHLQVHLLARALSERNEELRETNERLRSEVARREMISEREIQHWGIDGFIGESNTIKDTLASIAKLQSVSSTVLITGESGTGKELVARAVHHSSSRSDGPFVPVNCSALPAELAESILFGHTKGAFTGADKDRTGYFELAEGGTLFLDEIGDMPMDVQAKMLRVLEDGYIRPIGSPSEKRVDVRVVAATNVDLEVGIEAGTFRQDLFFRLARFPIPLPPLRDRKEDVPLLARHFLKMFSDEMGIRQPRLTQEALLELEGYAYPGNVRELKNIIERAVVESNGLDILPEHLHFFKARSRSNETSTPLAAGEAEIEEFPLNLKEAEAILVRRALEKTNGNITAAARLLGTHRPRVYKHLKGQEVAEVEE